MTKTHNYQEMNREQVKNILKFVDRTQSETIKENIFSQLGYECFFARKLDAWIEQYRGNVQGFLDRVNVQKASKYWEKLEYNEDNTKLILTGKKIQGCACAFADCEDPPESLCRYCCKNFQQEMFGMLFEQKVEVEITQSFLQGDDRCSTIISLI
jgi:predicted ArsR family transcriptional regulator